jgi:hypothetical protein
MEESHKRGRWRPQDRDGDEGRRHSGPQDLERESERSPGPQQGHAADDHDRGDDRNQRFSPDWSRDDAQPRYSDAPYYARNRTPERGAAERDEARRVDRDGEYERAAGGGREGPFRQRDEDGYYRGYYSRSVTPFAYGGASGQIYSESWTLSGPYSGRGPKGYKRSSEQIVDEASRRLEQDGRVDATDIEVTCEDGVIKLRGSVPERAMKRAAEQCVESIYGIDDVMNELRVTRGRSDSESTQSDERQPPKH